MNKWQFLVAMNSKESERAGWVGVIRNSQQWIAGWYPRDPRDTEGWPTGEGEHFYTGDMLNQAKEACLELIQKKEAEGYSLSFPIRFTNKPGQWHNLTVFDYYSDQHCNPDCYEELRKWRFQKAQELKVSPFIVATNRLLKQVAAFMPYTEAEAKQLNGMGVNKWMRYGKEIVEIVKQYERNHQFPLQWVFNEVQEDAFAQWKDQQRIAKEQRQRELEEQARRDQKTILECMAAGKSLEHISKEVNQSISAVLKHIEVLREEGYAVLPWLEREVEKIEELSKIVAVAGEYGTVYAKPIFQKLYSDVPNDEAWMKYDQIRTVFAYMRSLVSEKQLVAK